MLFWTKGAFSISHFSLRIGTWFWDRKVTLCRQSFFPAPPRTVLSSSGGMVFLREVTPVGGKFIGKTWPCIQGWLWVDSLLKASDHSLRWRMVVVIRRHLCIQIHCGYMYIYIYCWYKHDSYWICHDIKWYMLFMNQRPQSRYLQPASYAGHTGGHPRTLSHLARGTFVWRIKVVTLYHPGRSTDKIIEMLFHLKLIWKKPWRLCAFKSEPTICVLWKSRWRSQVTTVSCVRKWNDGSISTHCPHCFHPQSTVRGSTNEKTLLKRNLKQPRMN